MTFDGPVGLGTLYLAVYRKSDGFYRSTGTTFVNIAGLSDAQFRAGLFTASELLSQSGEATGVYAWTSGALAKDAYSVYCYTNNTTLEPSGGDSGEAGDEEEHFIQAFILNADGAGGAISLANLEVEATVDEAAIATAVATELGDLADPDAIAAAVAIALQQQGVVTPPPVSSGDMLTDLKQALANLSAKYLEVSTNPQPNYTMDGETWNMADYLKMLREQIDALNTQIAAYEPYELVTYGY